MTRGTTDRPILHLIGNSHIDPVWLWQWPEGYQEIRAMIFGHAFTFEHERIGVSVSLGVAQLADTNRDPEQFTESADKKLYEAKHGGRNRVAM